MWVVFGRAAAKLAAGLAAVSVDDGAFDVYVAKWVTGDDFWAGKGKRPPNIFGPLIGPLGKDKA